MSNYQSMIYIEENYSPIYALDLSDVDWQFFLIILFSVLSIISLIAYIIQFKNAIHSALHYGTKTVIKMPKSKPIYTSVYVYVDDGERMEKFFNDLTATECIYKLFHDNNVHQNILDIILKDYCGFDNPPSLDSITERKQQIRSTRSNIHCCIGCKLLVVHILEIILISSLICATYCGVILVIQNQDHLKKYSTFVQCECVRPTDLCKVEDDPFDYFDVDAAYDSFYDDIWLPYITQYEPSLINHFQSNNSLYLTSSHKNIYWCPDEQYSYDLGRNYQRKGWLYLHMDGLSESGFLSNDNGRMCGCFGDDGEPCCGCNDKPCCSCCGGWVAFAVLCLILCILIALIALAYINYPIEQSPVQNFVVKGTQLLLKDIQRVIKEIEDIDQSWERELVFSW